MNDNDCYVVDNETSFYVFDNVTCNDGDSFHLADETQARHYLLVNGRFIDSEHVSVLPSDVNFENSIMHKGNVDNLFTSPVTQSFMLISAVMIVLAFFSVIFRWFNRFRG